MRTSRSSPTLGLLRLALVDPGSVSLGALDPDGLPMAIDLVYQNTFADARYMFDGCLARGLAAHVSIFEPGFLRVALAYHACRRLPPAKIQLYFGGDALPVRPAADAQRASMPTSRCSTERTCPGWSA